MTYNDILEEFKEFTGIKTVEDFRPCCELYGVPNINNAIVVWLDKSGKKLIYISNTNELNK